MRGIFKRHCNTTKVDVLDGERHGCLVDEHYYASLFAYLDLAKETDCFGIITIADFRRSIAVRPLCSPIAGQWSGWCKISGVLCGDVPGFKP